MKVQYLTSFFTHDLKKHARAYLKHLPPDVDGLVSIGSSGCAIASAMMVLSNRIKVNVCIRKDHENAHIPSPTGLCKGVNIHVYAIVDDFIDTGTTVFNLINKAGMYGCTIKYVLVDHIWASNKAEYDKMLANINVHRIKCITINEGGYDR